MFYDFSSNVFLWTHHCHMLWRCWHCAFLFMLDIFFKKYAEKNEKERKTSFLGYDSGSATFWIRFSLIYHQGPDGSLIPVLVHDAVLSNEIDIVCKYLFLEVSRLTLKCWSNYLSMRHILMYVSSTEPLQAFGWSSFYRT